MDEIVKVWWRNLSVFHWLVNLYFVGWVRYMIMVVLVFMLII